MIPDEELDRRVRHGRLLALLLLVLAPAVFLIIAVSVNVPRFDPEDETRRFMLYIFFILAFLEPLVSILVRKFQVSNYRKTGTARRVGPRGRKEGSTKMTTGQFFVNALITQLSFVNAVFILGLIAYFVTADLNNMAYFYALGIIWSVIFWPREEKT